MVTTEALTQKQQYSAYVDRLTQNVVAALPINVRDEDLKRARARFRVAFSADANGALLECSAESIARAIVLSAMSGLFPGGPRPDVWLIPRGAKGRMEVNWQLSFRGYIRLARRAGWDLEPVLVFEGEEFRVTEGNTPAIHHVPSLDAEQSWETLRYGYVRIFPIGRRDQAKVAYLSKARIEQRRKKAQSQNVWSEWPLEMALKTLCNYAGNREMFPVDDPSRYAMEASEMAEVGGGSPLAIGAARPAALPAQQEGAEMPTSAPLSPDLVEPAGEHAPERDRPAAAEQSPKTREELVEDIRSLLAVHSLVGEAREGPLESAFGTPSWVKVCRMDAEALAAGLSTLRRNLEGMQSMREPGEDPETEP